MNEVGEYVNSKHCFIFIGFLFHEATELLSHSVLKSSTTPPSLLERPTPHWSEERSEQWL